MDQTGKVASLLFRLGESHPRGYIPRVNRDRRGVTCGVLVSCVERRDERCGEREVRSLKCSFAVYKAFRQDSLLLIQREESLGRERRRKNSGSVHGESSRYASTSTATTGA